MPALTDYRSAKLADYALRARKVMRQATTSAESEQSCERHIDYVAAYGIDPYLMRVLLEVPVSSPDWHAALVLATE